MRTLMLILVCYPTLLFAQVPPESLEGNAVPGQAETMAVVELVQKLLVKAGIPEDWQPFALKCSGVLLILLVCFLADLIARRGIVALVGRLVSKTQTHWDDAFVKKRVLNRLSRIAPALVVYVMVPVILDDMPNTVAFLQNSALFYMLVVFVIVVYSSLDAGLDIYRSYDISRRMPIKGFLQVVKIIIFFVAFIVSLSIVTGESPNFFLGGLGALTAVLMLIFKDSILGLVAGVQLSANNMVRRGDWIEMPQFGADGDVLDVSLTTVKVQNWDKTISTIPTYALISQSFKNWRGMTESQGRRIKRAISLDMNSVRFCDEEMIQRFRKIQHISEYIDEALAKCQEFNQDHEVDDASLVNGRRLTNLGTFRAYVQAYLQNHPQIHKKMTFLVRQLAPSPTGVAIEVYVFSSDKNWVNYEKIQGDIFDHLLAVVPEFDLQVFQNPTGTDFAAVASPVIS